MATLAPIKVPIIGVDQYTKSFQKMTRSVQKMGRAITSTGKKLTASLTVPIVGVGIASLKMSKDFNSAMANVGTLIPGQSDKLQKLKQDVLALGGATGVSSNLIAEGLYETISAFGGVEDPINKLRIATQMSVAGLSTVKEALSLVSAVTKGYGDVSDGAAQKVSDLSFLTVKLGQTTFPELAASMGNVVPLATTLRIKQEELFGSFATLTGVTGNASEVSTQLASALGAFIKPSASMTKQVQKLGFASSVAMMQELGLKGSLEQLTKVTKGDEIAMGKLLTRKEGLNAALTLMGPQMDNFVDKVKQMGDATGTTSKAYEAQTKGINKAGFAFDRFTEKARIAAIQIGDKLSPILLKLLDRIEPFIDKITNMSDETLMMGIKTAGAVALIGPALVIIGNLVTVGGALASVIGGAGGVGAAFALLTGPVGWAVAAIAGATAAVIYFWDELAPLREGLLTPIKEAFQDVAEVFTFAKGESHGLTYVLKDLVSLFASLLGPVVKFGLRLALLPLKLIARQGRLVVDVVTKLGQALNFVTDIIKLVWLWLTNLWDEFTTGTVVGEILVSAFTAVSDAVSIVGDKISEVWGVVSDFFGGVGDFVGGIRDGLDEAIDEQQRIQEAAAFGGLEYTSTNENYNQTILDSIELGQQDMTVNVNVENTSEGPKVSVTDARGKPLGGKQGAKGAVMPIGAM